MDSGRSIVFMVPGWIEERTGGSIYDRRMADGLRDRGWIVTIVELDTSFPSPTERALRDATDAFDSVSDGSLVVVDGLALSAMPEQVERAAMRLPLVALIHLPLVEGLEDDAAASRDVERAERRALKASSRIVVTGTDTLRMLSRYDLPPDRISIVEPGTDRQPLARGSDGPAPSLLSVGTLNPLKGHQFLLQALRRIADLDWRLTCAGSLTRHPPTVDAVRTMIRDLGLAHRVELTGELDDARLAECYDQSDVLVVTSLQETYGMVVAEALARGLPVVGSDTGAVRALVGQSAGIVVPARDVDALAAALRQVVADSTLRTRLAAGARRIRERLKTWDDAAGELSDVLVRVYRDG
jgi:glycosyltransferase involved in cell wall biosynthesis